MVSSKATTVSEYLATLPPDRRETVEQVRKVILDNLPAGFEEGMQYGMIGYYIPLSRYPNTYNGQALAIAGLASQKQSLSLYLMTVYGDPNAEKSFAAAHKKAGKKLDMGKSCVRFKDAEDIELNAVGEVIAGTSVEDFIARYERVKGAPKSGAAKSSAAKSSAAKSGAAKSGAAKSSAAKSSAAKSSAAKSRAAKSGAAKSGAAKSGKRERRPDRVRPSPRTL